VFGKFSMDTIASAAFGVDSGSFTDPNSQFVKYARTIFRNESKDMLKVFVAFLPGGMHLLTALGIPIIKPEATKFFYDVVLNTLRARQQSGNRRNDLIDLMIDAMKDTDDSHETEHDAHIRR
jgi:hypothetical protein